MSLSSWMKVQKVVEVADYAEVRGKQVTEYGIDQLEPGMEPIEANEEHRPCFLLFTSV